MKKINENININIEENIEFLIFLGCCKVRYNSLFKIWDVSYKDGDPIGIYKNLNDALQDCLKA